MIKIVVVGMAAALLSVVVRQYRADLAMVVSIAGGAIVLSMAADELGGMFSSLQRLADTFYVDGSILSNALKITGIAYIGEFGVQACRDAGENAIAAKVELGAKVTLFAMCLPMIAEILGLFTEILP